MPEPAQANDLHRLPPVDKVRKLQRQLWMAAKRSPERRFHALFDRIFRSDVLKEAWERVRANRGAAGVDRQTLADVETYGVERLLAELQHDVQTGRYRPSPVRRHEIPKPDGGKRRARADAAAASGTSKSGRRFGLYQHATGRSFHRSDASPDVARQFLGADRELRLGGQTLAHALPVTDGYRRHDAETEALGWRWRCTAVNPGAQLASAGYVAGGEHAYEPVAIVAHGARPHHGRSIHN